MNAPHAQFSHNIWFEGNGGSGNEVIYLSPDSSLNLVQSSVSEPRIASVVGLAGFCLYSHSEIHQRLRVR